MKISPVNTLSIFLILWFSVSVGSWNYICPKPETTCGNLTIRFPFRVVGSQPPKCGYPGFDLQCSPANQAIFELPGSVNLNVKFIDYMSQTIHLYDSSGCILKHARNLTLPFPFQFLTHSYIVDYTFFNCSSPRDIYYPFHSKCLSSSTYEVFAIPSWDDIGDYPLLFCSKLFNISSIPREIIDSDDTLDLMWITPMCKHCESKGVRCGFVKNDNTTYDDACFEAPYKGSSNKFVITGSIVGTFLLVVTLVVTHYLCNCYKSRKESQAIIEKFLKDYRAMKPTRYSYAEIKRITNQFEEKLGEGSFGTVYRGNISSEFQVAVKILSNSEGNGEEFVTEVGTMGKIHHINIIRLMGFCADGFRKALGFQIFSKWFLTKFHKFTG